MSAAIAEQENTVTIVLTHEELHVIGEPLEEAVKLCDFMNLPVPSEVCAALAKLQIAHDAIKMKAEEGQE